MHKFTGLREAISVALDDGSGNAAEGEHVAEVLAGHIGCDVGDRCDVVDRGVRIDCLDVGGAAEGGGIHGDGDVRARGDPGKGVEAIAVRDGGKGLGDSTGGHYCSDGDSRELFAGNIGSTIGIQIFEDRAGHREGRNDGRVAEVLGQDRAAAGQRGRAEAVLGSVGVCGGDGRVASR